MPISSTGTSDTAQTQSIVMAKRALDQIKQSGADCVQLIQTAATPPPRAGLSVYA